MKSRLVIFLLLVVLNFEAANQSVGAEPLPSQINSSPEFLFMPLNPDGVAATKQQRRKRRRRRNSQPRAKVYGIVVTPEEAGGAAPPPVQSSPGMDRPGRGAPAKRSAPRIKPPTVQIKPPTR